MKGYIILESYNKSRFKKSEIRGIESFAKEHSEEKGAETTLEHMNQEKKANATFALDALSITAYAKVPGITFLKIPGFEAPGNEGPKVNAALNFLDKVCDGQEFKLQKVKKLELKLNELRIQQREQTKIIEEESKNETTSRSGRVSKNPKLAPAKEGLRKNVEDTAEYEKKLAAAEKVELFNQVIKKMSVIFFYLEITDPEVLNEHQDKTTALSSTAVARNNDQGNFEIMVSNVLHLMFAGYPELEQKFGKENIVEAFIAKVISGEYAVKLGDPRIGWPKFDEKNKIAEITNNVKALIEKLKERQEDHHYTKDSGYETAKSSKNPSGRNSENRASGGGGSELDLSGLGERYFEQADNDTLIAEMKRRGLLVGGAEAQVRDNQKQEITMLNKVNVISQLERINDTFSSRIADGEKITFLDFNRSLKRLLGVELSSTLQNNNFYPGFIRPTIANIERDISGDTIADLALVEILSSQYQLFNVKQTQQPSAIIDR